MKTHALLFLSVAFACAESPLKPREAQNSFVAQLGAVELVAAEPQVVSPVAMAFDEAGRIYVAENRGYPQSERTEGSIALLEDRDGDGRFETRHDFAKGLSYPNGVCPWQGGVFVTCAPDILYLKDTDGDGVADVRRVVLTGFDVAQTTQLRAAFPTLGPDGAIYITSGLAGVGKITSPEHPDRAAVECRVDAKFDPVTFAFTPLEGRSQFGLTFDEFGRRFICMNRVHVQHVVLSVATLRRNPHFALPGEPVQDCPGDLVDDLLRGQNAAARVYPLTKQLTTADSHEGTFTAACGVHVWRSALLPEPLVVSCEPTGNLLHADTLLPEGSSFRAVPRFEKAELLASRDPWFRPVSVATGPDGSLYICDMYRRTIEHPQYLPEEIRKRTDFEGGKTMGRIWRLRPPGKSDATLFAKANAKALIDGLAHANGWQRDTAFRLLVERRAPDAVEPLRRLIADAAAPAPARARALAIVARSGALTKDEARAALTATGEGSEGLRLAALRAVEGRLGDWPELAEPVLSAAGVWNRAQAASVLGGWRDPQAIPALVSLAVRGTGTWERPAILSGLNARAGDFLGALLPRLREMSGTVEPLLVDLGRLLATEQRATPMAGGIVDGMRAASIPEPAALRLLGGWAEAARKRGAPLRKAAGFDDAVWLAVSQAAAAWAVKESEPAELRRAALALLREDEGEAARKAAAAVLAQQPPAEVFAAALDVFTDGGGDEAIRALLAAERWSRITPALHEAALARLIAQPRTLALVLDAVEGGSLAPAALSPTQRQQVLQGKDDALRVRAEKLFAKAGGDRMKIYEEWKPVAAMKGNAKKGRAVFTRLCAACHRLDGEGIALGPDLLGMRTHAKEAMLMHILVPNHEIYPGFHAYQAETADGRSIAGLLTGETPESITLRQPQGLDETLPRRALKSLAALPQSLMPDGMEQAMTRQECADLLAFLRGEGGR